MRRRILLASATIGLALFVVAGIWRVPQGAVGVSAGAPGPGAPRLLGPGTYFRVPLLERTAIYDSVPVKVEAQPQGSGSAASSAPIYTFWLASSKGDAAFLIREAPDGDLPAAARRLLAEAAEEGGKAPSASRAGEVLAPLGLVEGSLSLSRPPARSAPAAAGLDALRSAYQGPRNPVLVIGLDGADWDVMEPLIAAGEMPTLSGLRSRGVWGALRSMRPTLSPLLWTTVVTGRRPVDHGILDFLITDPASGAEVPVTSRQRRSAALWTILTEMGRPSLTVGWWATWPAEPVLGLMVTDRVAYSLFASGRADSMDGAVYPPGRSEEIASLIVSPEEIGLGEIGSIIDIGQVELDAIVTHLGEPSSWKEPESHLLRILASTRSYERIALESLREGQPPLSLIYFQGIDEVCHRFAIYAPPAMKWADPARREAWGGAVTAFYRYQDGVVGRILAAADPQTTIIVLSDHGFAWGGGRPTDVPPEIEGKPGRWHTMDGVIIAAGPGITPGRLPRDPGLLDLAPTLLALLGLPASEEMPGEAIPSIVAGVAGEPPARIATWEFVAAGADPAEPLSTPVDAEMLARLTALGYVDGPALTGGGGEPPGGEGTPGSVTGHLNTGNALLLERRFSEAEAAFREALALAPRYVPARLGLAQCLLATGRSEPAWREIEEALQEGGDLDGGIYMRTARFFHSRREFRRGAELFARLPYRADIEAYRQTAVAVLLEAAGSPVAAEAAMREGLSLDPALPEGLQLAYDMLTRAGRLGALEELLERALEARPDHTQAASFLALTLERAGRTDEAVAVLERSLQATPRSVAALSNLAGIHIRAGAPAEAIPLLRKALEVNPVHLESLVNMVVALGMTGEIDGAKATFSSAGSRAEQVSMLNAMAWAHYSNGNLAEAGRLFARSLTRRADQPEVVRLLREIEKESSGAPRGD